LSGQFLVWFAGSPYGRNRQDMAAINNLIGSSVGNKLRQKRATDSKKVGVQRLMPVAAAVVGLSLLHS